MMLVDQVAESGLPCVGHDGRVHVGDMDLHPVPTHPRQETADDLGGRHVHLARVACPSAATVGYALLGASIRRGTGLDERPDDVVEALLVGVLKTWRGWPTAAERHRVLSARGAEC